MKQFQSSLSIWNCFMRDSYNKKQCTSFSLPDNKSDENLQFNEKTQHMCVCLQFI